MSDRPLDYTMGHIIWIISSSGGLDPEYRLESAILVGEVGRVLREGVTQFARARGDGKSAVVFENPIPLNKHLWFREFVRETGNCGVAVNEITDPDAIAALLEFAAAEGWQPA